MVTYIRTKIMKNIIVGDDRKQKRRQVVIPVQVRGHGVSGELFLESTSTQDISSQGLRLKLKSIVGRGTILHLALPMPTRLRAYDLGKSIYEIYGEVVFTKRISEEGYDVGIHFLGKTLSIELEESQRSTQIQQKLTIPSFNAAKAGPSTLEKISGLLKSLHF